MSAISLKTLHSVHYNDAKHYTTQQLRDQFLLTDLEKNDAIELVYTHEDRMITGIAKPTNGALILPTYTNLKSNYFLERREIGIINFGGQGTITADGTSYILSKYDCLYIGKGVKEVTFTSDNTNNTAIFFLISCPAHQTYPTSLITFAESTVIELGAKETCNERSLRKYIHEDGIQSCQLVMGVTLIKNGSVWNTVPPHTHERRTEIYFYCDVKEDQRVFHIMGEPQNTRHLIVANNQAVISPSWSVHFGCGTGNYSFIWGMAGENKEFTDTNPTPIPTLL